MASKSGSETAEPREPAQPTLIAHRGFAGVYPENTVAAVERAVAKGPVGSGGSLAGSDGLPGSPDGSPGGAEMVEIDVMPTATGEFVVFHDTRPDRLTDAPPTLAEQYIWELSYDQLADLEVLASGESIPLLADVLDAIPPDVAINVEFKNPGSAAVRIGQHLDAAAFERHETLWRSFAAEVGAILSATPHDILVSSFHEPAIAAVRSVEPDLPVAFVFHDSLEGGFEVAHRYDCEAIHPPMEMIAGTALFDADTYDPGVDIVARAHAKGRAVNAWTVENWHQASQLRQAGVDGIIADYPGVLSYEPVQ